MSEPKQVLIVRKDLNMRKGKIAAQCAHASMKVMLDRMHITKQPAQIIAGNECQLITREFLTTKDSTFEQWLSGRFTKICVSVDSETELLDIYSKARDADLPCSLITDSGATEFHGIPTNTVIAIGPAHAEDIDKITGHLKLL